MGEEISKLMDNLDRDKEYKVSDKIQNGLAGFWAGFANMEESQTPQ